MMKTTIFLTTALIATSLISNSLKAQWTDITPIDTSAGFGKISFVDSQNGYVAGIGNDKLFRTTDGGGSWTTLMVDSINQITDVHFTSATVGYVIGGNVFPTNYRNVSKTIDGGATWQPIAPIVGDFYSAIYFKDANNGFLASQQGGIYKTSNAGINWTKVDSTYNSMNDESFPNNASDTAYFTGWDGTFGYQGVIAKTIDNGINWTNIIPLGWNTSFSNIHMLDGKTGILYKDYGGRQEVITSLKRKMDLQRLTRF